MKYITDAFGTRWAIDPFYYNVERTATIGAGASFDLSLDIESNSDFIWMKTSYFTTIAGNVSPVNAGAQRTLPFAVAVRDTTNGRFLNNDLYPISTLAGLSGRDFEVLPIPRELKAKTNLIFSFTNLYSAQSFNFLRMSLIGYKKFEM